jgi:hypothetical protein
MGEEAASVGYTADVTGVTSVPCTLPASSIPPTHLDEVCHLLHISQLRKLRLRKAKCLPTMP